jgi:hypothetical protein
MDAAKPNCKRMRTKDLLSSLGSIPRNMCIIAPQFITLILADNKVETHNVSSFIGAQKSSKIMDGINNTTAR